VELLIVVELPVARLHGGSEAIGDVVRRALATLMPTL
jgi:hypothetical protein